MLSVANNPFKLLFVMLNVIMLLAVMLSVVAPMVGQPNHLKIIHINYGVVAAYPTSELSF
jgi:hypothetical protein